MKWLSILLIIFYWQFADFARCPNRIGKQCGLGSCRDPEKCFPDLDNAPDRKLSYCCDMMCPTTRLRTYWFNQTARAYSYKMNSELNPELFYRDWSTSIACPYPYSHMTILISHDLPVEFSKNARVVLRNCKTNGDCGEGQYCGYSINPTYARKDTMTALLTQRDQSEDGKPLAFCYKDPNIGEKLKVVYNASAFGLPLCQVQEDCTDGNICLQMNEQLIYERVRYNGICVIANVCDNPNNLTSSTGVFTKRGKQCYVSADCSGLKDDVHTPDCVTFQHPKKASRNGTLCCFNPKRCRVGSATIPKMTCKNTGDCINGKKAWASWCDDQGFCCQDNVGNLSMTCPDGVTFPFGEPKCDGACDNGICFQGHCCPGLKYIKDYPILPKSPYTTRMGCDPKIPLPPHVFYSYCSPRGALVIIGTHDADGNILARGREHNCTTNTDCVGTGFDVCVREREFTACYRDPYKQSSSLLTILVLLGIIVVGGVIGVVVYFVKFRGGFKSLVSKKSKSTN